jgi:hypothetical protein
MERDHILKRVVLAGRRPQIKYNQPASNSTNAACYLRATGDHGDRGR